MRELTPRVRELTPRVRELMLRVQMALIARNLDTGTVLADRVSVAATRATRRAGLLHHDSLDDGEALWIVPSHGVHTFRMRFAIDVLALDEAGVIIDRVVNLKPWRIRLPKRGTAGVLELPAGWLDRTGTALGHRIEFSKSPSDPSRRRPIDSGRPDTSI